MGWDLETFTYVSELLQSDNPYTYRNPKNDKDLVSELLQSDNPYTT